MREEETKKEETAEQFDYVLTVHFDDTKKTYYFGTNDPDFQPEQKVVVETIRGMEIGTVVQKPRPLAEVSIKAPLKPILRKASDRDIRNKEMNQEQAKSAFSVCQKLIEKLGLDMNLISAEYTLDRSKIIFIYVADERVDFRELLKELASALHCRIELRQIGMRDKAKLIGGIGICGRECCCSRFLDSFDVVSINMAKNQMLALNTQKLSGQCGKLMCCLKYEDEYYKELKTGLPKMNSQVVYQDKTYRMTSVNILTHQVKLENREESLYLMLEDVFPEQFPRQEN